MDKTLLGAVNYQIDAGIARITFEHPAHNSLPSRLLVELAQTIDQLGRAPAVRVIILQSGGDRTFCAGASFDELLAISNFEEGKAFFMGFARVINAIRRSRRFVIGRVQGKAIGGGVGLAAATDYCFATQYASAKLSELAIGIGPFVVGPAVERKVGTAAFQQLAIDASTWQTADWGLQQGLYQSVTETAPAMDQQIQALAERLSQYSPDAMQAMKSVCWSGTEHWDTLLEERAAISGRLILTAYAREAIQAIKN